MRIYLSLLVFLFAVPVFAQNPKAVKLYDKANDELKKINKRDDDKPDPALEAKLRANALKYLNKATKIDPKYADAWALKAYLYEKAGDTSNACRSYRATIAADPVYQSSYFYYAKYLYELERYDDAIAALEKFEKVPLTPGFNKKKDGAGGRVLKDAEKLMVSAKFAKEEAANAAVLNIKNMGSAINSSDWEYWPGMTIDGKYFIYTRQLNQQEDFYISQRTDTGWSKSVFLPGKINTPENEGNTSLTPDGRFIFFSVCNQDGFGGCDIFYSSYNAATNTWGKRMNLGETVNSNVWDANPSIGADGKTLIFASSREGGYGGKDLWQTQFINGKWTTPENLGKTINTSDDEAAPFLHYDGRTLYFSSNGHPGFGASDIFISRKDADGKWGTPVNLGKGINTDAEEQGLYVEYKGKKAYFCSSRPGGFGGLDLYSFDLAPDKRPGQVSYVLGKVLDAETNAELKGRIEVIDLKSNQVVLRDSAFNFFTTLDPGGNYALNVYRQGYLFYSANFQPTSASIDSPFVVTAMLKALRNDQKIVLNNIFFDVDKFDLKQESYSELNTVLALLQANPGMKIAIEGHTDNSGSKEHNQTLSENRAKSVLQFLVSKGINAKRISSVGYGDTQPVAGNETAEGRALNRRIEMRVTAL